MSRQARRWLLDLRIRDKETFSELRSDGYTIQHDKVRYVSIMERNVQGEHGIPMVRYAVYDFKQYWGWNQKEVPFLERVGWTDALTVRQDQFDETFSVDPTPLEAKIEARRIPMCYGGTRGPATELEEDLLRMY